MGLSLANHQSLSVANMLNRFFLSILLVLTLSACGDSFSSEPELPIIKNQDELLSMINASDAKVTVVNFWATWCLPCVEEFPDFVQFGKEFEDKGVEVVFVSADDEDNMPGVVSFLRGQKVPWQSYLKTGRDNDFIPKFSENWSGGLPATFIYSSNKGLVDFWEGASNYDELKNKVSAILES